MFAHAFILTDMHKLNMAIMNKIPRLDLVCRMVRQAEPLVGECGNVRR